MLFALTGLRPTENPLPRGRGCAIVVHASCNCTIAKSNDYQRDEAIHKDKPPPASVAFGTASSTSAASPYKGRQFSLDNLLFPHISFCHVVFDLLLRKFKHIITIKRFFIPINSIFNCFIEI